MEFWTRMNLTMAMSTIPTANLSASLSFASNNEGFIEPTLQQTTPTSGQHVSESLGPTVERVELFIVIVMLSLFSAIGASGNALVLYVFSKKKDTLVSTQCIIALATVDFITCIFVIPLTIYMEYTDFHISNDFLCKLYQFLITSNIPFSALVMVAIALDRYLCICHPFLRILTVGRSKVLICVLWVIAGSLGLCVALMFSVYRRVSDDPNRLQNQSTSEYDNIMWNRFAALENNTFAMLSSDELFTPNLSAGFNGEMYASHEDFFMTTDVPSEVPSDEIYNSGHCSQTDLLLNEDFFFYYQKIYNTIFPLCFIVVVILYVMIYRSVLVRRSKRQKQKSKALLLVKSKRTASTNVAASTTLENLVKVTDAGNKDLAGSDPTNQSSPADGKPVQATAADIKVEAEDKKRTSKAESNRLANLKTAAMLFVVNVVFFVTFTPAFLIALTIVSNNIIVFYFYFANNVINPVIYSFMNKNFRSDLAKIFTYTGR